MIKEITIDDKKIYSLPEELAVVQYAGKYIVISPQTANWMVFEDLVQVDFLKSLARQNIQKSFENFVLSGVDRKLLTNVLIQLEARQFCSTYNKQADEFPMQLYLTNACNMRCPHCYMYAGVKGEHELTTVEVCELLLNYRRVGKRKVKLSGGEISLRTDLLEIIEYGWSIGIEFDLLTNGVAWTHTQIKSVAPYIYGIQISIDGYNEEENAKVRGKGNFQKALNTLAAFYSEGVKQIQVAITPWNDAQLHTKVHEYVNFARKLRKKYPKLMVLFTTGLIDGRELRNTKEEKEAYEHVMQEINSSFHNRDMKDASFIAAHIEHRLLDSCSYGSLVVAANGDVYTCTRIAQLKPYANLRKESFDDIIDKAHKAEELISVNNIYPCKSCELRYICGGGCRIEEFPILKYGPAQVNEIPFRQCPPKYKNQFYELMIKTNELIYQ